MNGFDFTGFKACMEDMREEYRIPGFDCVVYKKHKPVFRYFSGLRDVENNIEIDGSELYLVFSMTKMLTCAAALQLFERGAFSMEDKLSDHLPEFKNMKVASGGSELGNSGAIITGDTVGEELDLCRGGYAKNPIRIIDLFTMSAGFDYNLWDEGVKKALADGKTGTLDLVRAMSGKTLCFEPGSRFKYSLCHDILGGLVELWSGKKLGDYMSENIFGVLGMSDTFFGVPKDPALLGRIAPRYSREDDGSLLRVPIKNAYNISADYQSGGAGIISCTNDYAIFLDALACGGIGRNGNRILKEETVRLWKTNHLKGQALEDFHQLRPGYGYGLGVRTHMEPDVSGSLSPIGEFGWDGAAGAFSMVDIDNELSFTYFQHCHNWDVDMQTKMRNALYSCFK
ncbi:MAG: beta-lactamase family protein [Clostridia bacterium]|nr:beta-lactamase family protein [Clostridia bacterium]